MRQQKVSRARTTPKKPGGGYNTPEQTDENTDGSVSGAEGSENDPADGSENTDNENKPAEDAGDNNNENDPADSDADPGSGNETGDSENEDNKSDETGDSGNEDTLPDETDDTEEGDDSSDQPSDDEGEQDPSDEDDGENENDDPSDGADDGADDSSDVTDNEDDNAVTEDDVDEETTETVSANDLLEVEPVAEVEAKSGEVTEISYEAASGNGVQITAPYGRDNAARYSFTAPADGRYVFYTEEKTASTGSIFFNVANEQSSFSGNQYLTYKTDFLKQGETVAIQSYAQNEADAQYTYTLKAAGQTLLTKAENGSYSATLPGGEQLVINAEEGVRHLRFSATASSGSWPVHAYHSTDDHKSEDLTWGSLTAAASSSYKSVTGLLEPGGSYDTAYVVYDDSDKFVAMYSCILTTRTSEAEEGVYIHSANTDEENSITLDVETYGYSTFYCYYAPADGSETEKSQTITRNTWKEVTLKNLKSGTTYNFEFRDSSGNVYHRAEYTTAGTKIEASTAGSSAEISADFTEMTIKVKPEYNGTATSASLKWELTDSLDEVHKDSTSLSLSDSDKDAAGYFSAKISLIDKGIFLRPGEVYQVKISLSFGQDQITSLPETITVKAPEKAVIEPENITFTISQNETTKTTVNYNVEVTNEASIPNRALVCYRPTGTLKYKPTKIYLNSGKSSGSIYNLSAGVTYEFLLNVGGTIQEQSLKLATASGIELVRVEDAATDYTGPYDIVRTYKMTTTEGTETLTGSYYLSLQYLGEYGYSSLGGTVELNADNNYQATILSAERSGALFQPDTEYVLRWMLGKTTYVSESDAECAVYENIHTSTAKVSLEAGEGGCNYQNYTVTLDAGDIVNVKANSRGISLAGYLKKEGDTEYKAAGSSSYFYADNEYSDTLKFSNLEADTRYDLSLRNNSGETEYAKTSFTTAADQRTVSVTSVDTFIDNAVINYSLSGFGDQTTDYILCYYREARADNTGTWKRLDYYNAGSANSSFTFRNLKEDTSYEYRIGIGSSYSTIVSKLTHAVTDSFTTRKDERQVKVISEKIMVTTARIECSLHNMEYTSGDNMYLFIREVQSGTDGVWERKNSIWCNSSSDKVSLSVRGLKEKTGYEYKIGFGSYNISAEELKNAISGSFTTYEDQRKAEVTSVEPKMMSAVLNCAISGMTTADETSQYLVCFVQEKGSTEWTNTYRNSISANDNPAYSVLLTGLTSGTEYSYKIGFANTYSALLEDLINVTEGTFTTYADTRKLEITGSTPKVLSANIAYTLSGMEYAGEGYLIGYVKKKADAETAWSRKLSKAIDNQDTSGTVSVTGLEEKTEYEVIMGFGDTSSAGKDELKHPQTVTFTTLEDQRKVSNPKASVKGTNATLSVQFEGNIERLPSYVHFYYRKKGTTEYEKVERVVNATNVQAKECSVTVSGLTKSTTYEFVAVLSENQSICDKPDEVAKPEFKTEIGEFEIEASSTAVVKPTSVTLSPTKLFLNANVAYSGIRGYGYETLKATVSPAKASAGFKWVSSDENVVTVSGGRVTAVSPGTATVTVTSSYNEAVSAVCDVVVGNYQIAKKDTTGMELLDDPTIHVVKGGEYSGYTVCKIENGNSTEVSFKVSSDNEVIASWNEGEGKIKANSTGSTKLVFETEDQVKLYLQVTAESAPGKGFAVTGFTAASGYEAYAAVQNGEKEYTLAYTDGISYSTEGEIVPQNPSFWKDDFNWTIDKPDIATVDKRGNITPLKAGDAVLSVTPKEAGDAPYTKDSCQVTLHIKSLASESLENATPVYALADISSKIGDVKFPNEEAWKGWQWKEPDTPLVINGVNKEYYPFEAVYTGSDHYPEETTVNVYIAKVTGLSVFEEAEVGHNQVVEVGSVDADQNPTAESDSITLTAESLYYGSLNCNEETNYFYDVDVEAPANVVVKKHEFTTDTGRLLRTFSITATKAGNYTLTPVIKVKDKNNSNEKILAKTTYKIKAVEDGQAYIRLTLEEPVKDGILLDGDRLIVDHDKKADVESFKVKAELLDRNLANAEKFDMTKLVWSVSDKKVATVTASSDTHSAEVKIVGEGHTILTAKVKDAAGRKAELKVEIQNHAPRVDRVSAKVNLAYDYDSYKGLYLASQTSGAVEIVPVYGEGIQNVSLYTDADATKLYTGLRAVSGSAPHSWVICPTAETKTGAGNYYLGVKTNFRDALYVYPLKVTVVDQQATVTAKSVRASNLFYRSDPGSLDIAVKGNYYGIDSVTWTDNSSGDNNGYTSAGATYYAYDYTKRTKNATRYYFMQEDIQLTANKKLVDAGIVSGKVEVQLGGYKQPNIVSTSLKWNYKKPTVTTINSSYTLVPAVPGKKTGYFYLYNKTDGRYLNYSPNSYSGSDPKYRYNELVCSSDDVRFDSSESLSYTYTGSKTSGSEKFTVTISGDDWRESLNATHTIKLAAPVPYLTSTKLTMNTNRIGSMVTDVKLKGTTGYLYCTDIIIQGKDAKAQKLLDEDLLEIRQYVGDASRIVITENRASTMKQSAIANGTYNYIVIPCYEDADGNRIQSKKLSLKITVTDKEITAKTKASRSLDLTKKIDDYSINGNYIRLDTTFKNIGNYFEVIDSELVGEYSEYFNLYYNARYNDQRLTIANESELKAGQKYKLAIRFTLKMREGDTFTVTGAPFTVKPKQTSAKIMVYNNNQTLYTAADTVSRSYSLQALGGNYRILKVEGSLDCNKDGRPDITVASNSSNNSSSISAQVRIADRDGVLTVTGAKGKTYTIPVTVQLKGRDGITKDVKTSIKVTVKR